MKNVDTSGHRNGLTELQGETIKNVDTSRHRNCSTEFWMDFHSNLEYDVRDGFSQQPRT